MAFGSYEVGVIQRTPMPKTFGIWLEPLQKLAKEAWALQRQKFTYCLTSNCFLRSAIACQEFTVHKEVFAHRNLTILNANRLSEIQAEINEIACNLYGIDTAARQSIEQIIIPPQSEEYFENDESDDNDNIDDDTPTTLVSELLDYALGAAFGRWDIRHATGELPKPAEPEPFDPLPVCPPGMLQNADGLPCSQSELPAGYPLTEIPWNGILVDDENHPLDLIARVREVFSVIWPDHSDAIEAEACEILKARSKPREHLDALRVWFRDPNKFFKDHLARHSKSRRKAPIYWPLSTESGSYTLWIYYHRLDSQTLYSCIEIIDRKREDTGREIEALRAGIGNAGTGEEQQRLEDLAAFQSELKTLRDRLLETARLPYRPDLNDGVQITASPLSSCFRLGPWQKILRQTWDELSRKEKYDWSHLAMSIWPERVVPKCAKDRSLAIAQGIEDLFWVPDENGKLRPLRNPAEELKVLYLAGHPLEVIDLAGKDADAAGESGLRAGLWVRDATGGWRRRKSPHEEIAEEVVRRKGK